MTTSTKPDDLSDPHQHQAAPIFSVPLLSGGGAGAPDPTRRPLLGGRADTPHLLRYAGLISVMVCLLTGVIGAGAALTAAGEIDRAATDTAQVVTVERIYAALLRADVAATEPYLKGGEPPPEVRRRYVDAMNDVADRVAEAAARQPADRAALAALNRTVRHYSALVERGASVNRQGMPYGAQLQADASDLIRQDALPLLRDALGGANETRSAANRSTALRQLGLVLAVTVVGLLILASIGWWLARRTHRYLNSMFTAGVALVILAAAALSIVLGAVAASLSSLADGPVAQASAAAQARSGLLDARSAEMLRLVARGAAAAPGSGSSSVSGGGPEWERRFQHTVDHWTRSGAPSSPLDVYRSEVVRSREIERDKDWTEAVKHASTVGTLAFQRAEAEIEARLRGVGDRVPADVTAHAVWPRVVGGAVSLACVVAAVLTWNGIARRLEEYR